MNTHKSLLNIRWECKYHVVFIPKYREKILYGQLRKHLGFVIKDLVIRVDSEIEEGHLMGDHVYILISIPPKNSVSKVRGNSGINTLILLTLIVLKKKAVHTFMGNKMNYGGQNFWA